MNGFWLLVEKHMLQTVFWWKSLQWARQRGPVTNISNSQQCALTGDLCLSHSRYRFSETKSVDSDNFVIGRRCCSQLLPIWLLTIWVRRRKIIQVNLLETSQYVRGLVSKSLKTWLVRNRFVGKARPVSKKLGTTFVEQPCHRLQAACQSSFRVPYWVLFW